MMYFQCLLSSGGGSRQQRYEELLDTARTEAAGREIDTDVDVAKIVLPS